MGYFRRQAIKIVAGNINEFTWVLNGRSLGLSVTHELETRTAMSIQDFSGAASAPHPAKGPVFFERKELELILRLYGRKVAAGDWRDYSIDALGDAVAFCVFRRSSEAPLYRIEKRPALARKQGAFAVFNQAGLVLKRGRELAPVLAVLDKTKFDIV